MNDGGERKPGTRMIGGPVACVEQGVHTTSLVVGVQPGSDVAASDEPLIFLTDERQDLRAWNLPPIWSFEKMASAAPARGTVVVAVQHLLLHRRRGGGRRQSLSHRVLS